MPRIYVNFSGLSRIGSGCSSAASRVDAIRSEFQQTIRELDWDVRFQSNINSTATQLSKKLEQYSRALESFRQFIESAHDQYVGLDEYIKMYSPTLAASGVNTVLGPDGQRDNDWNKVNWDDIFKNIVISAGTVIPSLLPGVSPITPLLYITSGILWGNSKPAFDDSREPSSKANANWLGYETSDDNPGVTAWLGKASAETQNETGYAGVNAYLGKAEGEAKAEFSFMKTEYESEDEEDKGGSQDKKKEPTTTFLSAEAAAGASVSALAVDAYGGIGDDMLGLEGKAEGTAGSAKAEAKGKFSVSDDGVNAYVEGEAMVSAVEGKVEGTINILGLEITGEIGGYAGGLGVEGKAGIEENKFVLKGGAAALIGGTVGLEVGFNEEGWDNFVDFIVFWD